MVYSQQDFDQACQSIITTANYLHSQGWTPATSSNFSQKLDTDYCAITVSGKDKGRLTPDDIMIVDLEGKPRTHQKPSAETLLHTSLYGFDDSIGAVLHTHSLNGTLISLLTNNNFLQLEGYELLKAFSGINTHEDAIELPFFENTQDIASLAQEVINYLKTGKPCWGYLIKGHGVYTWGKDMASALRHLEAIEYLMKCELEIIKIKGGK